MRSKKQKQQVPVEYKSSTWTTEIKGNFSNPKVRNLIVSDFVLRWIVRIILTALAVIKVISQITP